MEQLSAVLHEALASVLRNQPEEPLVHLMSHFREKAGLPGTSAVSTAYRKLLLCPPSRQQCENNIMEAYESLCAGSSNPAAEEFQQLLSLLADPLPEGLQEELLLLFQQLSRLPPDFGLFRAAAKSCMLLEQLATGGTSTSPSHQMFLEAEARKLLLHLLREQQWFEALQPVPRAPELEVLSAADVSVAQQKRDDDVARAACRLVGLAVEAAQGGNDS